jgi:hypothetical protein
MEAPRSSETSVLTRATRRNNPEDTILHINSVRTSRETRHVSARESNQSALFRETVAVYSENRTGHTYILSSCFTGNTSRLRYRTQPVNAVWGNSRSVL